MYSIFNQIAENVKNISSLPNMMPVLCLTTDAVPIITSFLHLEDSSPLDIQLPLIAASSYEKGRIMCFPQLNILYDKYFNRADTSKLISNSINWLSPGSSENTPILLLGFDTSTIADINKSIQSLGITTESDDEISNISKYNCIFIPSNITPDIMPELTYYVKNGGGLAVFCNNTEIEPINNFLLQFGLSYTYCVLNEGTDDLEDIKAPPSYAYIKESHFVSLLTRYKAIMNLLDLDESEMDDFITTLRYYVIIFNELYFDKLIEMAEYAWIYLNRKNYSTKEGICSDIKLGIVLVLLQDIYDKIPVDKLAEIPEASFFPGKTGSSVELKNFEISLDLVGDSWISTGLWIPSSKTGTVSGDSNCTGDVLVQIGSHSDSLLSKSGPWKRWPKLVSLFNLKNGSLVVGSPFGGIVYAFLNNDEQKSVNLVFDGFSKYPRAVVSDPSIWEETKDIDVPWGELDTGKVIFTLPSSKLREIPDFNKIKDVYDVILNEISDFSSFKRKQRIIFDIDFLEGEVGYPIFLNIDQIDDVLIKIDHPTVGLFNAVFSLTLASIRIGIFENQVEHALATVSAAKILKKLFPDFDPFNFNGIQLPLLFSELWEIDCNFNNKLISLTLSKFLGGDYPVSEDTWIDFVKEMCILGKRDFTKLFENGKPIPLSKSSFTQGLQPYQPLDKE